MSLTRSRTLRLKHFPRDQPTLLDYSATEEQCAVDGGSAEGASTSRNVPIIASGEQWSWGDRSRLNGGVRIGSAAAVQQDIEELPVGQRPDDDHVCRGHASCGLETQIELLSDNTPTEEDIFDSAGPNGDPRVDRMMKGERALSRRIGHRGSESDIQNNRGSQTERTHNQHHSRRSSRNGSSSNYDGVRAKAKVNSRRSPRCTPPGEISMTSKCGPASRWGELSKAHLEFRRLGTAGEWGGGVEQVQREGGGGGAGFRVIQY